MLTVAILINGEPIVAKNAVFQGIFEDGRGKYLTDSGETLWHNRDEGAVALAKMLLDTIRNDRSSLEREKGKKIEAILKLSPDGPEDV